MGVSQIAFIVLLAMNLGISFVRHGECRTKKYNFFVDLFAVAIEVAILYCGGFFEVKHDSILRLHYKPKPD